MFSKVSTLSSTAVGSECNPQVKLELCKLKHDEQRETESRESDTVRGTKSQKLDWRNLRIPINN